MTGRPPTTNARRCEHLDREVHALGYCKPCYDRAWRLGQDDDSAYRRRARISSRKRKVSAGAEVSRSIVCGEVHGRSLVEVPADVFERVGS